jgi:hypothetical protein
MCAVIRGFVCGMGEQRFLVESWVEYECSLLKELFRIVNKCTKPFTPNLNRFLFDINLHIHTLGFKFAVWKYFH